MEGDKQNVGGMVRDNHNSGGYKDAVGNIHAVERYSLQSEVRQFSYQTII